ncbi:MAG: hypothetical protein HY691_16910 [Chloroflexi bacterium]|nr:hypothetical protein [Chloroflexota bacterium]
MVQHSRLTGSRLHPDIEHLLWELAATDRGPTPILAELKARAGELGLQVEVPSLRTVKARLKEYRAVRDPSACWSFADADPDEAERVLPVIAAVAESTRGWRQYVTRGEAQYIVKIRRAAPDIPLSLAFWLAYEYIARAAEGQSTAGLDLFLSSAPWSSDEAFRRFAQFLAHANRESSPAAEKALRILVRLEADAFGAEFGDPDWGKSRLPETFPAEYERGNSDQAGEPHQM